MLTNHPATATLPASDMERAKRFYAEKLELTLETEDPGAMTFRCGGDTRVAVYRSAGVASGTHTQMTWRVDNIENEVAALKSRGVVFEEYATPEARTVDSIAATGPVKVAWFKDTEGNLLGLIQFA